MCVCVCVPAQPQCSHMHHKYQVQFLCCTSQGTDPCCTPTHIYFGWDFYRQLGCQGHFVCSRHMILKTKCTDTQMIGAQQYQKYSFGVQHKPTFACACLSQKPLWIFLTTFFLHSVDHLIFTINNLIFTLVFKTNIIAS